MKITKKYIIFCTLISLNFSIIIDMDWLKINWCDRMTLLQIQHIVLKIKFLFEPSAKINKYLMEHLIYLLKFTELIYCNPTILLTIIHKIVSSASLKYVTAETTLCMMYRINKNGPKTISCGTPLLTNNSIVWTISSWTLMIYLKLYLLYILLI